MAEWLARPPAKQEVCGSNPASLPLLKHTCGESNWLLCWPYTLAEVWYQRWISGNIYHIHLCKVWIRPVAVAEWVARQTAEQEVGGSNPDIPPLLKHACGEGNWLLCWHYTLAKVSHQRWISGNVYYVYLRQVRIRQNPLWLWNPEETSPEVQNRGISGPTNGHVSNKKIKKKKKKKFE